MLMSVLQRLPGGKYLREISEELKKVTWPTRDQTLQKTTLVIVASVAVGLYVGALDFAFTQVMGLIIK